MKILSEITDQERSEDAGHKHELQYTTRLLTFNIHNIQYTDNPSFAENETQPWTNDIQRSQHARTLAPPYLIKWCIELFP